LNSQRREILKTIAMECKGSIWVPLVDLHEFQGDLKTLSLVNFEKLKRQIVEEGFSFTPHVWFSEKDQKYFILDGHQRLRVVRALVEQGWSCPDIPCSEVFAPSYQKAKRKLLSAASQYGQMDEEGLLYYLQETDIKPEEIAERYATSDLNLIRFVESNYEGFSASEMDTLDDAEEEKSTKKLLHICPRCSFEFV
jgi:hypothetical protein